MLVFLEDRALLCFVGVGGEDEDRGGSRHERDEPFPRDQPRELHEHPLEGVGLWRLGPRIGATAADAMVLLREVDELEVVGERAGDPLGEGRVEGGDRAGERLGCFARCAPGLGRAPRLGEPPDRLFELEQRGALLLHQRVAEDAAEIRDVPS